MLKIADDASWMTVDKVTKDPLYKYEVEDKRWRKAKTEEEEDLERKRNKDVVQK